MFRPATATMLIAVLLGASLIAAGPLPLAEGPQVQAALDRISAGSMRGNLSFLASDALEGRATPSRGLEIAAEFIASQFRRAGLQPPNLDGKTPGDYFQVADFTRLNPRTEGFSLTLNRQGEAVSVDASAASVRGRAAMNLENVPIYKQTGDAVPDAIEGKAVLVDGRGRAAMLRAIREKKPALILLQGRGGAARSSLVAADQLNTGAVDIVSVRGDAAAKFLEALPGGLTDATLTLHSPAPQQEPVKLRNVVGILPGSDPQLKDTYILVTAHYDHLGVSPSGEGDRIYNGANDDGSGVVSLIELSGAMASMQPHPRRSVVFMAVFGEELGLLGSQYYGRHPVVPLDRTIADINIEQVGRTDDTEGPQVATATFTGFAYSDVPALFAQAGKRVGVKLVDRNSGNDPYFARSDNQALADAGIPAHTVAVSLEFGDYHKVGDEWQKIDYTNMALIDRMLGLGIISLADSPETPKWNESNPNTKKYRDAWKTLHPVPQN